MMLTSILVPACRCGGVDELPGCSRVIGVADVLEPFKGKRGRRTEG